MKTVIERRALPMISLLMLLSGSACSDEPGTSGDGSDLASDVRVRDFVGDFDSADDPDDEAEGDGTAEDADLEVDVEVGPDADADVGSDAPESDGGDIEADPDGGDGLCDGEGAAYTGTNVRDENADPIRVDDVMLVTVEVFAESTVATPAVLRIATTNLDIVEGSVERGGVAEDAAEITGGLIDIPMDALTPAVFTFEGTVENDDELILVLSRLDLVGEGCTIRRSESGAVLQVIGGVYKISECMDMRQVRTLQVAPNIQLQPTADYREQNGVREDLLADDFIYCPQHPAKVHVAEFCITTAPSQAIALAGNYRADADWEVDDFMLFEVFEGTTLLDDGFTTQTHPGGDTFWCGDPEVQSLVCTDGCQASLTVVAEEREIDPIAVVSAVGDRARRFDDGAVEITDLLPDDGSYVTIRITCLDMGIEGLLDPQLYIVSDAP